MKYFLLVFDRSAGQLVDKVEEYATASEAMSARLDRELCERGRPEREIVVLGAEDVAALERTHSRYFGTSLRELSSL